jgi:hypothetical protein
MNLLAYDKSDLLQAFGKDSDLSQIFSAVEELLRARGEVVCQFRVNGLNLTEENEKKLAQVPIHDIELLEVESQLPSDLIGLILREWTLQLPSMIDQADRLSKALREKGFEGQMRALVQLIDSCQMLVDSLVSFDSLYADHALLQSNAWKSAESFMAKSIGEALEAFQKKDLVLLADVMEYDIGQALVNWSELLVQFDRDIASSKEGNANSSAATENQSQSGIERREASDSLGGGS